MIHIAESQIHAKFLKAGTRKIINDNASKMIVKPRH